MKLSLRIVAMITGLVGTGIAFIIVLFYTLFHIIGRITGLTADSGHFFIGLGLCIVAGIGAFVALGSGVIGAALMVIAAIGLFFVIGGWAFIPAIFLIVAALLAFSNRMLQRPAAHNVPTQTSA